MSATRASDGTVWTPEALSRYLDELAAADPSTDVDWRRYEILDGMLMVSPEPTKEHGFVIDRLRLAISAVLPPGLHLTGAVSVPVARSYRVTDMTVVARTAYDMPGPIAAADVVLAVEVESPSSVTTDRVTKAAQYAAACIPFYWRVELDPIRVVAHRLTGSAYAEIGAWSAGETVRLREPFPLQFEVSSLLPD